MARPAGSTPWTEEQLTELAAIPPRPYGALTAFAKRHPEHSINAARTKLAILRMRRIAADTPHRRVPRTLITSHGGRL